MHLKMGLLVAAVLGLGAAQLCVADSIDLEISTAGTMYYNTVYTNGQKVTTPYSGTVAGALTGPYDSLGTTLGFSTASLGAPAPDTANPSPAAWILTNSSGKVADLIVFNVHTIYVYAGIPEPDDSSYLTTLPASKSGYDLTDPSGLAGYLENVPVAGVRIAAADISTFAETYVTDTDLSGYGYKVSGVTSGAGAMQFDGIDTPVPTTITFVAPVPLPPAAISGLALGVGLLAVRRVRRRAA